jgi:DNA-binding response OmpR family regulator
VSVPTVLIADDEPLVAKLYARAISALGLTPVVVGDGQAALDAIVRHPPSLLITDIHMPGLDGLQVLTWLAARKMKRFPVLMLSGDDDVAVLRAGLAAGADDFIIKGMAFSVIQSRVQFWLATGLEGLTTALRAAALAALENTPDLRRPAARLNALPPRLFRRVETVMAELLGATPADYGKNHTQQVRFLAVLDRVTALATASDGLAHLRRLDIMAHAAKALGEVRGEITVARLFATLAALEGRTDTATHGHAADTLDLLG